MKKQLPHITNSELEVMKLLWNKEGPVTSAFIVNTLESTQKWNKSTVLTLITRLAEKGAIRIDGKQSRSFCYVPVVSEKEFTKDETRHFIQRLYGGRVRKLFAALCEDEELDEEEVEKLRQILRNGD